MKATLALIIIVGLITLYANTGDNFGPYLIIILGCVAAIYLAYKLPKAIKEGKEKKTLHELINPKPIYIVQQQPQKKSLLVSVLVGWWLGRKLF